MVDVYIDPILANLYRKKRKAINLTLEAINFRKERWFPDWNVFFTFSLSKMITWQLYKVCTFPMRI